MSRKKSILLAWIIAATLDMLTAILVYSAILHKITPERLIQGIASGVFKENAFYGGSAILIFGILFHYCIAFIWTLFYFFIYPRIPLLGKNTIISGLIYGLFVWVVMNLIVLEIVFPNRPAITFESFAIGASILMVMIGQPIAFFAHKFYSSKN